MKRFLIRFALSAFLVVTAGLVPAQAGLIIQPVSASTDMGSVGALDPEFVRDQSGLSAGYTSQVTDFGTYIAGNPTHDASAAFAGWSSATGNTTGNLDFVLGDTYTIQSFVLWNAGEFSAAYTATNVKDFELLAADNASFTGATSLGTFTATTGGSAFSSAAQVFTFAPTQAAFVRMVITSNFGSTTFTSIGEAAFEGTPATVVPEPSTLFLAGTGVVGLMGYAARHRRRVA